MDGSVLPDLIWKIIILEEGTFYSCLRNFWSLCEKVQITLNQENEGFQIKQGPCWPKVMCLSTFPKVYSNLCTDIALFGHYNYQDVHEYKKFMYLNCGGKQFDPFRAWICQVFLSLLVK